MNNWKKMELRGLLLLVCLTVALISQTNAAKESLCSGISKQCTQNTDCCDGCCLNGRCVFYSENCIKEKNPCYLHECPPNQVCYLQKVYCIQAPCPPIPACKPRDYDYN